MPNEDGSRNTTLHRFTDHLPERIISSSYLQSDNSYVFIDSNGKLYRLIFSKVDGTDGLN